jgi:nitrite reductase/ring-hydroxylating ferredoxin subunit
MIKIEKKAISQDRLTIVDSGEKYSYISIRNEQGFRIYKNLCPHMGGYFETESFCQKTKTISCIFHCYKFSMETGKLVENPNVDKWIRPFVSHDSHFLNLKNLKLIEVPFTEDEYYLYIK